MRTRFDWVVSRGILLRELLPVSVLTCIDACRQPLQGHGNGLSISAAAPKIGCLYAVHCGAHDSSQWDAQMLAQCRGMHCGVA